MKQIFRQNYFTICIFRLKIYLKNQINFNKKLKLTFKKRINNQLFQIQMKLKNH